MPDPRIATAANGLVPWETVQRAFNTRHRVTLTRQRIYQIAMKAEHKVRLALADDPLACDVLGISPDDAEDQ